MIILMKKNFFNKNIEYHNCIYDYNKFIDKNN